MERHSTIPAYLPTLNYLIDALNNYAQGNSGLAYAAREGL